MTSPNSAAATAESRQPFGFRGRPPTDRRKPCPRRPPRRGPRFRDAPRRGPPRGRSRRRGAVVAAREQRLDAGRGETFGVDLLDNPRLGGDCPLGAGRPVAGFGTRRRFRPEFRRRLALLPIRVGGGRRRRGRIVLGQRRGCSCSVRRRGNSRPRSRGEARKARRAGAPKAIRQLKCRRSANQRR